MHGYMKVKSVWWCYESRIFLLNAPPRTIFELRKIKTLIWHSSAFLSTYYKSIITLC